MLSGQMHLALGCFALSIFTAAASAEPSWEADTGGIRFLPGFVRWWPLTASATRATWRSRARKARFGACWYQAGK